MWDIVIDTSCTVAYPGSFLWGSEWQRANEAKN